MTFAILARDRLSDEWVLVQENLKPEQVRSEFIEFLNDYTRQQLRVVKMQDSATDWLA